MKFRLLLLAIALLAASCNQNSAPPVPPPVQVVSVAARQQPVTERISLVGTMMANEYVAIKNEIDGRVELINFDEGQPVVKGRLLIQLDQGKLAAALAQSEANFKLADANLKRNESLLAEKAISQREADQAVASYESSRATVELMKQQLKDTTIFAAFDGVMGARVVSPGQVVTKGTTLTSLVSLDPIKIEFKVPERFLSELRVGQSIAISVAAYPGQTFTGNVYFVDPRVDEQTRTALLKARLSNPDQRLKPGMFSNLELTLRIRDNAIVIPEAALILLNSKASVFVLNQENVAQQRGVEVGLRLAGEAEITSGLAVGDRVVVEGHHKLQPGAKVVLAPAAK